MRRITKVVPRDNYCLEVWLDDGSSVVADFAGKLATIRFGMLADRTFFNRVTTDGKFIRWEDKIELSLSEILMSQGEGSLTRPGVTKLQK